MEIRDYQFDNLKGFLIFLVVFGHLIQETVFKTHPIVGFIYSGIYLFHMPLFIFISGYFSKKNNPKRIVELFLVYMLWQMVICPAFTSVAFDQSFLSAINPLFSPKTSYWYLLSFIIWRILTPTLSKIKLMLPISLLLGLCVGFSELNSMTAFSFARTVAFYPFFLSGYLCTPTRLASLRQKINKYWGFLIFSILIVIGVAFLNSTTDFLIKETSINKSLFLRDTYKSYLINPFNGVWIRMAVYLLGFGLTLSSFTFVSVKKCFLSIVGQNTLFIYLTHAMLINFINKTYLVNVSEFRASSVLISCGIISILYCSILSLRPISIIGRYLTTINSDFLFKEGSELKN